MTVPAVAAAMSAVLWLALILFRGGFWRADQRLDGAAPGPQSWPGVVAVVPARNEAECVSRAMASLVAQDYAGAFAVVLVDDGSDDGTADLARRAGDGSGRLTVIPGAPLEAGWTGKLWALSQGLERARTLVPDARYVLLTDADIEHDPHTLCRLVAKAEAEGLDLVSLMVLLRCESPWERLLIPAFVFFFQKLYPFPRVNDRTRPEAAAAGGCVLVRRDALERSGGVAAIRGRLIDDCALARRIKDGGPIWLGLTESVHSLRAYHRLGDIWRMVVRTAFTQLDYSVAALLATVIALAVIYMAPPVAIIAGIAAGDMAAALPGAAAWALMAAAFLPTLRLYRMAPAWSLLLPLAALLYTLMTIDSARRHWLGAGGAWKGRDHGPAAGKGSGS